MASQPKPSIPIKKLVLCFDGTGNTFSGSSGDTNIVKLYHKFDREDDGDQFHYYQTGIGTYDINSASVNKGFFGGIKQNINLTLDEALATSFDAHVIAGYRFLMRYYDSGDKIYIFGFSRGAFTARFLARMVNTIGVLSKGNEEMAPFAYQLFQKYEQGKASIDDDTDEGLTPEEKEISEDEEMDGESGETIDEEEPDCVDEVQQTRNEIVAFRRTFCRRMNEVSYKDGKKIIRHKLVKVFFLGIFDCVSSVAVLDSAAGRAPKPVSVRGTAAHVRHAVAVDERRVKFRAALLNQDFVASSNHDDCKEVWFPGNHGDIGGGWPAKRPEEHAPKKTFMQWLTGLFYTEKSTKATKRTADDPYQMSDVALSWMIHELEEVDKYEDVKLNWNAQKIAFEKRFREKGIKQQESLKADMHDTMKIGGGCSLVKVSLWNFMEYLPIPRYELSDGKWKYQTFPLSRGSTRDIPKNAILHSSLKWRLENMPEYTPKNNHGDSEPACLTPYKTAGLRLQQAATDAGGNHELWTFDTPEGAPFVDMKAQNAEKAEAKAERDTAKLRAAVLMSVAAPAPAHGTPELIAPKASLDTKPVAITVSPVA